MTKLRKQSKNSLPKASKVNRTKRRGVLGLSSVSEATTKYFSEQITKNVLGVLDGSFLWEKPHKYWYKPILLIRLPYPYIQMTEDGIRGLFIGWYEINIGKRKIINTNYKEEFKKWKDSQHTVYFINRNNFKLINKNDKAT
jgi:hypothetical protein